MNWLGGYVKYSENNDNNDTLHKLNQYNYTKIKFALTQTIPDIFRPWITKCKKF